MAANPAFASTPKLASATISTANSARDGTGTIGTIVTGGTSGSRIDTVLIKATVTTTAGMIRLFVHNGTTYYLITEIYVPPQTASSTVPSFETQFVFENGLLLPTSSWSLRASTQNAESFNIVAIGGDF